MLLDLLSGAGVSAVGTTLLHSPGWNEGKARYETLGKHRQKRIELRRSGTTEHSFGLCHCRVAVGGVPLLKELKGCRKRLTQGLRPGLCRSIALAGLFADEPNSSICRKLSDLLGGVGSCVYYWIYGAMSVVTLVVGLVEWCWRECRRHDTPAKPRVE